MCRSSGRVSRGTRWPGPLGSAGTRIEPPSRGRGTGCTGTSLARAGRSLGRGCHSSRWPGQEPHARPAAARELGRSEVCSKWTEPRAGEKGGRAGPGSPSLCPGLRRCPGIGLPWSRGKKICPPGLKGGLRKAPGRVGRGEQRNCRLRPGVRVCVSLDLTFYTSQRPTWSRVARPSPEVM